MLLNMNGRRSSVLDSNGPLLDVCNMLWMSGSLTHMSRVIIREIREKSTEEVGEDGFGATMRSFGPLEIYEGSEERVHGQRQHGAQLGYEGRGFIEWPTVELPE